jgi:hypothetical protein
MTRVRLGLAVVGFVLAFLSVALNDSRVGWAAISALLGSAIIRLVQRKREKPNSTNDPGV